MTGISIGDHVTISRGFSIPLIVNGPSAVATRCETSGFFSGIVLGLIAMIPFWAGTIWLGARLLNHV